ncbi:MAG TPA: long-chain-fatty-acid--CoA ligase [Limnochordales bacterium]
MLFFRRTVRVYGQRVGVVDGDQRWTYEEFARRCNALAWGLRDLGLLAGERAALLSPNTHRALECYYAVPLAGGILVPLNIRLSLADYRYILRHCQARLLLADPELQAAAAQLARELPQLRLVWLAGGPEELSRQGGPAMEDVSAGSPGLPPGHAFSEQLIAAHLARSPLDHPVDLEGLDENELITLNYTSGTTAHSKGVMLSHRNAALNVVDFLVHGQLRVDDVYLHTLPMFHVNGWGGVWAVSAAGATHVCLPRIDVPRILELIDRLGVTMACAAPTVMVMIASHPAAQTWRAPRRVRWYVGGAAPPAALIEELEERLGFEVVHVYGLTETSPWLTVCEWRPEWAQLDPARRAALKARQGIGQLMAGEVRVARPDLTDVAADGREVGEIVVRGPTVMKGYYLDPEATQRAMEGGWLHTGDLAVLHPDGYIQVVDRAKDIIITGGENVSSLEVESVLYQHPAVLEAAVVAAPDPKWGEVPKAFVVVRPGSSVSAQELIDFCRERMAHFKAPKQVEFVEALPKTATGKIQKYLLRQRVRPPSAPAAEEAAHAAHSPGLS